MILFSNDKSNEGSKIRLLNMAMSRVTDIRTPKAEVPPKLEAAKIKNPAKRIIAE